MSEQPANEELPEYRDYLGEALSDHQAGPVKKSKFMVAVLCFAGLYLAGILGTIIWRYLGQVDLSYAYFAMTTTFMTPFVGSAIFIIGFLRRYRYKLGKTVERAGIAIFVLGWVSFAVLLISPVTG